MAAVKVKKIKVKTHSGAKKRFQVTGSGKVKFQHAYKRHRLVSKDSPKLWTVTAGVCPGHFAIY